MFQVLARSGARARQGPVAVRFLRVAPASPPRVAYAVSRRVGGAVVRNRVRRRLRAGVQLNGAMLVDGAAYLVSADPEAARTESAALHRAVRDVLAKARAALVNP